MSRRNILVLLVLAATALTTWAAAKTDWQVASSVGRLESVFGRRGLLDGDFVKPRALAIDSKSRLYTVDMRAAIQVFTADGEFLTGWRSPDHSIGRPSGLGFDRDGHLLVADSHYHQILVYTQDGVLLRKIGGEGGDAPLAGEFGYIGDVAADSQNNLYIAESQQNERITKINPSGRILKQWGSRGPNVGQFQRIRALAFDKNDRLFVADACNHRIQVFDVDGRSLLVFGVGLLRYPYDVAIAPDGGVYVCEWGANRIHKFTSDGHSLGTWGEPGRKPGQLSNPWAVAVDGQGRVFIADSDNHRIQRISF